MRLRDACYAFLFLVVCMIGCGLGGGTSTPTPDPAAPTGEAAQIDELITKFQTSYSKKRFTDLRACFHPKANVAVDFAGGTMQSTFTINEWILAQEDFLKDYPEVSDVLSNREITVYRNIGTAVCDYDYRGGSVHQTGQDIFMFTKFSGEWKIVSLAFYGDNAR